MVSDSQRTRSIVGLPQEGFLSIVFDGLPDLFTDSKRVNRLNLALLLALVFVNQYWLEFAWIPAFISPVGLDLWSLRSLYRVDKLHTHLNAFSDPIVTAPAWQFLTALLFEVDVISMRWAISLLFIAAHNPEILINHLRSLFISVLLFCMHEVAWYSRNWRSKVAAGQFGKLAVVIFTGQHMVEL